MSDQPEINIVIQDVPKTDDDLIEIANDLIKEAIEAGWFVNDVSRVVERGPGYGVATVTIELKWKVFDERK